MDMKVLAAIVISLIVGLGIGYGAAVAMMPSGGGTTQGGGGTSTTSALRPTTKVYKIGFTLPLSGSLSSIGKPWERVVEMGIKDLNAKAKAMGCNVRFEAVVLDDATQDEKALQNVQTFAQQGIKLVIGPAASSQVKAVKSYADSNHIVIISPSSTAPTLSIPDDFIFRTVGSDALQAKVLATLVAQEGFKKVVVFYRNDEYGTAFAQFFKKYFENDFGGSAELQSYTTDLSDYSSEVNSLSSKVSSSGAKAVVLISFDTDGANILSHASQNPVLSKIRWFASEGIHGASELLQPSLASFLMNVKFMGTRPVTPSNVLYKDFVKRFKAETGEDPPVFSENLYDAIQIAGMAILMADKYDGDALKTVLPEVAKNYYGPSGWTLLDDNGDKATQNYAIWTVSKAASGKYEFKDVGTYEHGSVIFMEHP
ncbi:MAG: ABC transporter substrate-binding protein [Desulfurococcales archaeon]|nr:ABC transporter substrate-binding protein [Desulfurococcales archaeon]